MGRFDVDTEGFAAMVRRRHPGFIFAELVANAFDQPGTESVHVTHEPVPNRPLIKVTVTDDDPTGFADLRDAYTLYRRTPKRADVQVRGRFNFGEKEFVSICLEATITTTIGQVSFKDDARKVSTRHKTEKGTEVSALVKMNRDDYARAVEYLEMFIPPEGVSLFVNGEETAVSQEAVGDFKIILPTEVEDEEGDLRRTVRKTRVLVTRAPDDRETPWLFEMGIPVCEIAEDTWDINIFQKVPLAQDRDSVTPGYLRKLRVAVLNNCHEELDEEDATQAWVTEAIADKDVEQDAFESIVSTRFGDDAVVYDPSDRESNNRASADGRRIIYGGSIPKGAHDNVKRFSSVPVAGTVFPTAKAVFGPQGQNINIENPTGKMTALCEYTKWLAQEIMGVPLDVRVVNSQQGFSACYGDRSLLFNLRALGHEWFRTWQANLERANKLIIHEFGHEYEENHLSENYHEACCEIGAKLAMLVLKRTEEFARRTGQKALVDTGCRKG